MSAQDHKPNYTIPNQYIFGPFLGLFDLYFGQKYQKVNGFDLRTHIPWTNEVSWVEKYWSHPLANSKNIISVRRTCVAAWRKKIFFYPQLLNQNLAPVQVTNLWSVKMPAFPAASWSLLEHRQVLSELEPTQMHFFQPGWPTCDYWNCNLSLAFKWSAAWPNTAPACIWPLTTGSKFEWISIENPEKCCQLRAG